MEGEEDVVVQKVEHLEAKEKVPQHHEVLSLSRITKVANEELFREKTDAGESGGQHDNYGERHGDISSGEPALYLKWSLHSFRPGRSDQGVAPIAAAQEKVCTAADDGCEDDMRQARVRVLMGRAYPHQDLNVIERQAEVEKELDGSQKLEV